MIIKKNPSKCESDMLINLIWVFQAIQNVILDKTSNFTCSINVNQIKISYGRKYPSLSFPLLWSHLVHPITCNEGFAFLSHDIKKSDNRIVVSREDVEPHMSLSTCLLLPSQDRTHNVS